MFAHYLLQIIMLLAGVVSLLAALFNYEWFFGARNAQPVVKYIGRRNARLLYGAMGVLLIFSALFFYHRISHLS
ncbi:MAG: immunity 17 family protein [Bacteroidaceae bacterium]|nr:immunity 17 family protein [Bacteroidaceae bacterium]MBR5277112.1 immunity 17 family protein [Bacteroidaceae bacterium]MBR5891455.1 immunity 17 family protein [Bacteroidaceae bacterium]